MTETLEQFRQREQSYGKRQAQRYIEHIKQLQAPQPPDYSAEGLIDIVVDFDPFYEQNLVKGMFPRTCTWLRNHMCYYPEGMNGFCGGLGWCPRYATQEPVDRGDGGGGSR